jgi:hypothetical protein
MLNFSRRRAIYNRSPLLVEKAMSKGGWSSSAAPAACSEGNNNNNNSNNLTRNLLVNISGNRATWEHMGVHGGLWQVWCA